ncbi:MAG TPA: type II secretion system protein GspL [Porticoccus sp.]|nr:type II secretion system protein GspL [Porticoccus sp.]
MNDQLVLCLSESILSSSIEVDWDLYDAAGHLVVSDRTPLESLYATVAEKSSDFWVAVLVPAENVLLASIDIPSQQSRQIKQALPFMVEELIADEIESVHIAIPELLSRESNLIDVAVIAHRILIDWLDQLHSHQLAAKKILIDALSIPYQENNIAVLVNGDRVLVRSAKYSGMAVQSADFPWLFSAILEQHEHAGDVLLRPTITLIHSAELDSDKEVATTLQAHIQQHCSGYELKTVEYQESVTDILAATVCNSDNPEINLLQGGYAINVSSENSWRQWRLVASIAGFGVISYLLLMLAGGWYFEGRASELDRQSITLYKEIFPNERRVVSPTKQMKNHLQRLGTTSNSNFLPLFANTSSQLSSKDNKLDVLVDQLRFDSSRGDLQFQVQTSSLDQLDQLKQLLAGAGLDVEINSATEQDDHIMGRIVVRSL